MKKVFCTLAATILILSVSLCNTAFAVDLTDAEPIEPSYLEIIEDIFPGYQDGQVSPQWTSGAPDAANPKTHGYITQVAYNLIRNDNSAAYSFYSGRLTKLVRGSVLGMWLMSGMSKKQRCVTSFMVESEPQKTSSVAGLLLMQRSCESWS